MQSYSVKQFCDMVGVPFSTLRYYEKIGLLKPEQDKRNKYRKYTVEDAFKVNQFKRYRAFGFNVDEVMELMTCHNPRQIIDKIDFKQQILDQELLKLQQKYKKLNQLKENIFFALEEHHFKIVEKEDKMFLPASKEGIFNATTYDEFSKWVEHLPITNYSKVMTQGTLLEKEYHIDYGISIDKSQINLLKQEPKSNAKIVKLGKCVCFYLLIQNGKIVDEGIFKSLNQFLEENHLKMNGDFYLEGVPVKGKNQEKKVNIVWVSVKEK